MKSRLATVIGITAAAIAVAAPAMAMGSGNPYLDLQTGVSYTVYQPTYTAGLQARHVGPNLMTATGVEQNLSAVFGKRNQRNFAITEGNPMSQDIGVGRLVKTVTVQGRKAQLYAYCDPSSSAPCTMGSIAKVGGHLTVTLPGSQSLRETIVWVETIQPKPIAGEQLVKIAEGLKPVQ